MIVHNRVYIQLALTQPSPVTLACCSDRHTCNIAEHLSAMRYTFNTCSQGILNGQLWMAGVEPSTSSVKARISLPSLANVTLRPLWWALRHCVHVSMPVPRAKRNPNVPVHRGYFCWDSVDRIGQCFTLCIKYFLGDGYQVARTTRLVCT